MRALRRPYQSLSKRLFATSAPRSEIRDASQLQKRVIPLFRESRTSDLLSLQWPAPPQNILIVKKDGSLSATEALLEFAKHVNSNYPSSALVFEPSVAAAVHDLLPFPIYSSLGVALPETIDLVTTFGGDGTILHASSLFAAAAQVPPILSFSMGTLGFLGEWKFAEYKRAFREVYMSGAGVGAPLAPQEKHSHVQADESAAAAEVSQADGVAQGLTGWSSIRGKSMGPTRTSKVLLRNRLKVGVFNADGTRSTDREDIGSSSSGGGGDGDIHAMNEVIIHRGANPHLAVVEIFVGGRYLTEAVADGMIVSTPTGSTAYSLSSGGSIVHPLVPSLLLTPVCPRSLSFRPLVFPANTPLTLRLSGKNRGRELEVSVDGRRRGRGVGVGMEIRVLGEEMRRGPAEEGGGGGWSGGVPCVMRGTKGGAEQDEGWVGGLNGLLKFNYPFGEE